MKLPDGGFGRVVGATGRVSEWVSVGRIQVSDSFVMLEGGSPGLAAVLFSWVGISYLEFATEAEVQSLKKKEVEP